MNIADIPVVQAGPDGPWVACGGALPSGSLKILTFQAYLATLDTICAAGFVEMTSGCTAHALAYLAAERGLPVVAVTDPGGAEHLRATGFTGEIETPASVDAAIASCTEREQAGWIWPRQMVNPALVPCVVQWAEPLVRRARDAFSIRRVVTGFGTGATAIGLQRAAEAHGLDAVLAVECPPDAPIPGWRHFASQNLGEMDLFAPFVDTVPRRTAPAGATASPLDALLATCRDMADAGTLIVAHDADPDDVAQWTTAHA